MYWSIVSLGTNSEAFNVSAVWWEQEGSTLSYSTATHQYSLRQSSLQRKRSVVPYKRPAPGVYALGFFLKQSVDKDYSICEHVSTPLSSEYPGCQTIPNNKGNCKKNYVG